MGKGVVQGVQLVLLFLNFFFGIVLGLIFQQCPHTVPQFDHTLNAALGGFRHLHRVHPAVFPVIDFSIYQRIRKIADGGICFDGQIFALQFLLMAERCDLSVNVLDRFCQQAVQRLIRIRLTGRRRAERSRHHFHLTQHHVGIIHKIAVHLDSVIIGGKMYPLRLYIYHAVPFLQEQNIRYDFRTSRSLERIVGQTDRAQQFCPLCNVLPYIGSAFVHGKTGGHKGDDAARTNLVQRFGNEVFMDGQVQTVISFVRHFELTKRYIADRCIKEVIWEDGFLIPLHRDTAALIELSGNAAGKIVQLHAVQPAVCHILRQHTEKIAHAAGWFQKIALRKAHLLKHGVDPADDHGRGVERCQRRFSGSSVLGVGQQFLQFTVPGIFLIEEVNQTTPAHILRQNLLLLRHGGTLLGFYGFQQTDGIQISLKSLQRRAFSNPIIGDMIVPAAGI